MPGWVAGREGGVVATGLNERGRWKTGAFCRADRNERAAADGLREWCWRPVRALDVFRRSLRSARPSFPREARNPIAGKRIGTYN